MNFENQIQQWIAVDNQLKQLNEKTRELREKRTMLSDNIVNYASKNNLSNINISDGRLKITNARVPEPLTFKYVEKTLAEVIKNEAHVTSIVEHLKNKRAVKNVTDIKRFSNN
jgi:hypothetical protein